jgi:hypothetical protein
MQKYNLQKISSTYLDDPVIIQIGYQCFDINTNNYKQKKKINWCIIGSY